MKKKLIMAMTVVFALCLVVTVFAFNQSPKSTGDNCPMKTQTAEKQTTGEINMTNVTVAGDGDDCCQPGADCCKGGSCCKGKHS